MGKKTQMQTSELKDILLTSLTVLYQFNCKAGGVGRQVTKLKVQIPFGPKEGVPDRLQASK